MSATIYLHPEVVCRPHLIALVELTTRRRAVVDGSRRLVILRNEKIVSMPVVIMNARKEFANETQQNA